MKVYIHLQIISTNIFYILSVLIIHFIIIVVVVVLIVVSIGKKGAVSDGKQLGENLLEHVRVHWHRSGGKKGVTDSRWG